MLTQVQVNESVASQRRFFYTGQTKDISFRIAQLKALKEKIQQHQEDIVQALATDLKKPKFEAILSEVAYCIDELDYTIKHLKSWAKPKRVSTPFLYKPGASKIIAEPLGVVLIIAPWNYPFQLTIAPLIGAIAAGNCAILKPSEVSAATSNLIAKLIGETFDPNYITVVEGEKEVTQALLEEKFDHIFFTGGTQIGKIIMEAAAKQLTPVTLELGGKSPCLVDRDINLSYTAKRITWGKFLNAGQTCIAPDYLLVHRDIKENLIAEIQNSLQEFYGENPADSPDYARMISDKHFQRLSSYLEAGEILIGGETNAEESYIAPTLIQGVNWDSPIMQEEIFGPILPILEYEDVNEAITQINARPKPLALYIFSNNTNLQEKVLQTTSSGGVCINDTIVHLASKDLPFGGVGESGIGNYHGKASFDTFSHSKSVLQRSFLFDVKLRYPPYAEKMKFIKWFF